MLAAGGGTIVNVSSGAAIRPLEGWSAYCSAKAGLHMLTRAIALETAGKGIRVFGFQPGTTDTDMQVLIRASGINPVSQIPRGNLTPVAHPAAAIVYLCTAGGRRPERAGVQPARRTVPRAPGAGALMAGPAGRHQGRRDRPGAGRSAGRA